MNIDKQQDLYITFWKNKFLYEHKTLIFCNHNHPHKAFYTSINVTPRAK